MQQAQIQAPPVPASRPPPTTAATASSASTSQHQHRQVHSQLLRNMTGASGGGAGGARQSPLANISACVPRTTAIARMNPKKLFVLVRILLAYLEKSHPQLHAEAERVRA